jgi:hypothetical protein
MRLVNLHALRSVFPIFPPARVRSSTSVVAVGMLRLRMPFRFGDEAFLAQHDRAWGTGLGQGLPDTA